MAKETPERESSGCLKLALALALALAGQDCLSPTRFRTSLWKVADKEINDYFNCVWRVKEREALCVCVCVCV